MGKSRLHIMLKPVSGLCNLRCKYCFYADETTKRDVGDRGTMSPATLENVLRNALAECSGHLTVAFQGGEPMLAGQPFFEQAMALAEKHNVHRCRIDWAIQTNGTLLDEDWCLLFARGRFLVGVSLDGDKALHDTNRVDPQGRGSYNRVLRGIRLLEKHRVDFNILTVLTSDVCRSFRRVYNFYSKNNWDFQQYIPCLDPLGEPRGARPWSLTPERYAQYLKTAFDCWYGDILSGRKKYHRYFDNLLLLLDGQPPEACGMGGICGMQYVVEADGCVYPCDFYMLDQYQLGNLNEDSFADLDRRREELRWIEQSREQAAECAVCPWHALCRGGCRRDRDYFEAGIGINYFCAAYREFFPYAYPRLVQVHQLLSAARNPAGQTADGRVSLIEFFKSRGV